MAEAINSGHLWSTGVRTGNKVVLKFGDTPIAFAQSARFQDDYGLEPVHVVGQLQAIEYVPMHARHQIQVSLLVVRNASLAKLGFEPASAGSYGVLDDNTGGQLGDGTLPADPPVAAYTTDNELIPGGAHTTQDAAKTKFLRAIHQKVFDIVVYDSSINGSPDGKSVSNIDSSGKITLTPLVHYRNCFFASGDLAVDANRVLMHNVTFMAQDKVALNSGMFSPGFA